MYRWSIHTHDKTTPTAFVAKTLVMPLSWESDPSLLEYDIVGPAAFFVPCSPPEELQQDERADEAEDVAIDVQQTQSLVEQEEDEKPAGNADEQHAEEQEEQQDAMDDEEDLEERGAATVGDLDEQEQGEQDEQEQDASAGDVFDAEQPDEELDERDADTTDAEQAEEPAAAAVTEPTAYDDDDNDDNDNNEEEEEDEEDNNDSSGSSYMYYFLQQRNGRWKASTADPNVTRADLKQWAQFFLMSRKFKHEQPGTADAAMEPDARQDTTKGVVDDEQPREGENEQQADQEEVHEQPFVELDDESLENTAEAVDHQPAGEQEDETVGEYLDAEQSEEHFDGQEELGEHEHEADTAGDEGLDEDEEVDETVVGVADAEDDTGQVSDEEQVDEHEDEPAANVPTGQELTAYYKNADRVAAAALEEAGAETRAAFGSANADDNPWATAEDAMTVENSDEDGGSSAAIAIAMASIRNCRTIDMLQLDEVDNTDPEYTYHNWLPQDANHAFVSDGRAAFPIMALTQTYTWPMVVVEA